MSFSVGSDSKESLRIQIMFQFYENISFNKPFVCREDLVKKNEKCFNNVLDVDSNREAYGLGAYYEPNIINS